MCVLSSTVYRCLIIFTADLTSNAWMHGFWEGRGAGTSTLKANLIQELISMREDVLHEILLDLQKSYGALGKERCLEILDGHGVGPRTIQLLRTYWGRIQTVEVARCYYGPPLKVYQWVNQ